MLRVAAWLSAGHQDANRRARQQVPGNLLEKDNWRGPWPFLCPSLHPATWDTDVMAGALSVILEYEDEDHSGED